MQHFSIEELGKGIWFMLHFNAKHATTPKLKEAYRDNTKNLATNFPCAKCRPHFQKFLDEHPLRLFDNILNDKGEDIGYFQWSFLCHNKVNKFLNKYTPSFEEAYNFFYGIKDAKDGANAGECTQCASPEPSEPSEPPKPAVVPKPAVRASGDLKDLKTSSGVPGGIRFQEISLAHPLLNPPGLLKPAARSNANTFLIPHKRKVLSSSSIRIVGPDK